jgi:hypothetical protein
MSLSDISLRWRPSFSDAHHASHMRRIQSWPARPAYRRYVDRFQHATSVNSAVMPRHKVLLIRFRQTVIDIWGASSELVLENGAVQRYCEAFTSLDEGVEHSILNAISRK